MLFHFIAAFVFISTTGAYIVVDDGYDFGDDPLELAWPERYTVRATMFVLTSGLVEDFTIWKSNTSSRVDFNNGVVKEFSVRYETEDIYTVKKYEIRPITTDTVLNKLTCRVKTSDFFDLDDILPYTDEFKSVGNETIDRVETTKFESFEKSDEEDIYKTIWAYYDNMGLGEYGWIPVKQEVKKYNRVFGSLLYHMVMEYSGFDQDFDDPFVFDVEVCEDAKEQSWDKEELPPDLAFVDPENDDHVDHVFNKFKINFDRKYADEFEHKIRKMIFQKNMRMIRSVNKKNLGYMLAINEFADKTPDELKGSLGALPPPPDRKGTDDFPYNSNQLDVLVNHLPEEYDAREEGLVTPIKNQGSCGSCWTFAATAVVEGALTKANGGRMMSLSNQAIVDCAYEGLADSDSGGCEGGYDFSAYEWIMKHGLPTEAEYGTYRNKEDYCHIANMTKTYRIRGYTDVTQFSNNAMKVALTYNGPLFIYIHVNDEFYAYSGGIFYQSEDSCPVFKPNHGVVLVGYGTQDGEPFWILKNSWGTAWGESGYMRISARDSVCGVSAHTSYPVL